MFFRNAVVEQMGEVHDEVMKETRGITIGVVLNERERRPQAGFSVYRKCLGV